MAEILGGVTIPTVLSGALSALRTAYNLYDVTKWRREQVKIILSRCQDLVTQTALRIQDHADLSEDIITGAERIQSACESVKGVVENLNKKGFMWCLLNADKIDIQVQLSKDKIQDAFTIFAFRAQFDAATFQSDLVRAQIKDKEDLSAHLYKLAENDRQILDAIQDQSGAYKRLEDLLIGVYKHVQHIPIVDDSELTPENRFLRTAADALGRKYKISTDRKFAAYILSSFEVDIQGSLIGSGAMGQVFTGEWRGSIVAIKRMHSQDARVINEKDRRSLRHEIKIWATLHHENILPLYGACPDADVPFLVMKYCPDGDVRHFLQRNKSADRLRLSCDVAVGLAFLHSKSIVHADVKGANVLVNGEHRALLTDFGLSIVMNDIRSRSTYSQELQDKARGTMAWMAPEVHTGAQLDKAADVYSLAMTIWEIFSDQNPFSGTRIEALSDVVRQGARPSKLPGFPEGNKVWEIVQDCWTAEPKSRPESKEVMMRLKRLIKPEIPSAPAVDAGFFGDSVVNPLSRVSPASESQWTNGGSGNYLTPTSSATANNSLSARGSATPNSIRGGPVFQSTNSSRQDLSTNPSWVTAETTTEPPTPDPEDPVWTTILQAFPPQWKHVDWGARHYVDAVTLPFVLVDKSYRYRVQSGRVDLGIRDTYELSADGSQRINFLEYNEGFGIIDSKHIKVFVVDPDGREALAAYWNPHDKPLGNLESEYARHARAGGVCWVADNNSVLSVTLKHVLNNKDYMMRILRDGADLGVRLAVPLAAGKVLDIDLTKYNDGQGLSLQSLIKVLVVDPDVGGPGNLVAGWWQPPGIDPNSLFHPQVVSANYDSKSGLTAVTALSHLPSSLSEPAKASSTPNLPLASSPSLVPPASYTPPPPRSLVPPPEQSAPPAGEPAGVSSAPVSETSVVPQAKKKHFWKRWK